MGCSFLFVGLGVVEGGVSGVINGIIRLFLLCVVFEFEGDG